MFWSPYLHKGEEDFWSKLLCWVALDCTSVPNKVAIECRLCAGALRGGNMERGYT